MIDSIWDEKIIVAVDYDDTIAKDGVITPEGAGYIRQLSQMPIVLVLWTCRHGQNLKEALTQLQEAGLEFDYINDTDGMRCDGRKINADLYIDDKNPGGVQWELAFERIEELIDDRKQRKNHEDYNETNSRHKM